MSQREGQPVRRLRALHPVVTLETAATILPGSPRVGDLDALLREVDGLRLTLETDLSLAASAVEAGAPSIALDIIENDRVGLAAFEGRALGHLSSLSSTAVGRRRFRVPAAPFVAAAAMVGFLVGVVPNAAGPDEVTTSTVGANGSLTQLQNFAADGHTSQVRAASATLHQQLLAVVAAAGSDPAAAQQALLLLSDERDAIVQSGDSFALHDVLVQSTALANRIRNAMPATIRKSVPVAPFVVVPTATPSASPKPSAKPTPSATPSPTASPAASPSPSASPRATSSPSSEPGVLPSAPTGSGN